MNNSALTATALAVGRKVAQRSREEVRGRPARLFPEKSHTGTRLLSGSRALLVVHTDRLTDSFTHVAKTLEVSKLTYYNVIRCPHRSHCMWQRTSRLLASGSTLVMRETDQQTDQSPRPCLASRTRAADSHAQTQR